MVVIIPNKCLSDEENPIICVPWKVVQRIAQEIAPDVKWTKPACIALSYSCDDFMGELFLYADWVRKTSTKRIVHLNHFRVAKEIVNRTQKRYGVSPFQMDSPPVPPPKEMNYELLLKNAEARVAQGLYP
tara:strand:- start:315 stop:704 length:390 start_codon:yes stop_codon:yes gene_type:complete